MHRFLQLSITLFAVLLLSAFTVTSAFATHTPGHADVEAENEIEQEAEIDQEIEQEAENDAEVGQVAIAASGDAGNAFCAFCKAESGDAGAANISNIEQENNQKQVAFQAASVDQWLEATQALAQVF